MEKDIQILMVAPQPFFENRGVPISVYLRCRALTNLGCQIDLVTFPQGQQSVPDGLNLCRIPNLFGIGHVPAGPSLRKLLLDFVMFFYLIWFLASTDKNFACIHAHEEGSFLAIPISWIFNLPLVYDYHSNLAEITRDSQYGLFDRLMDRLEMIALKGSEAAICVTPSLTEHVRDRVPNNTVFSVPDTAQEEILNDPDGSENTIPENLKKWLDEQKITLVYTGSLAGYQTMDLFLEGMAKSARRNQMQFLLVGGTSSELNDIRTIINNLQLNSEIMLSGRVQGEEIPAYLDVADVLVAPRAECRNTPLKIYTYLWAGKPMLVSDVEAHRVIFAEEEVIWAEPSVKGYKKALDALFETDLAGMKQRIEGKYEAEYAFERFQERHAPFVEWLRTGPERTELR